MSQPPKSTILAPSLRWMAFMGVCFNEGSGDMSKANLAGAAKRCQRETHAAVVVVGGDMGEALTAPGDGGTFGARGRKGGRVMLDPSKRRRPDLEERKIILLEFVAASAIFSIVALVLY